MLQEQWRQLEIKFFIDFWHENCYLDGKINLRQGSLPGEGSLEFFKVGGVGWGTEDGWADFWHIFRENPALL